MMVSMASSGSTCILRCDEELKNNTFCTVQPEENLHNNTCYVIIVKPERTAIPVRHIRPKIVYTICAR